MANVTSRFPILAAAIVLACYGVIALAAGVLIALVLVARARARVRAAGEKLAEVRAAKEVVEETAAEQTRLLDIAAKELSESEARFRAAFVHSPLGLTLVSLEGKWLRVNKVLCEMLGRSEPELLKTDFQALTYPDDLTADLDLLQKLLAGEIDTYHLDKRYIRGDGSLVWCRLDVSLHRDPANGEPRYFISQVQDISERRRAEELLRQAKDEAEKANEAKNQFLSRMSHELRTPLNAILGFGQLLELHDLGTSNNQGVSYVLTAGRHLLGLINEVLDLSSIESGKFTLAREPTAVARLLDAASELMRPLAADAGVKIDVDPGPVEATIMVDPRRLGQVLRNLISNAVKYNRPGGRVTVRCCRDAERWRIEVRDTGPGIAAGDVDRIFAPFGRLAATQEVPGTGLGLSLSRSLTVAMGGTLTVRSEPGAGSTFAVEFPCAPAEEAPPVQLGAIGRQREVAEEERVVESPGQDVLYVEDDATNLELVQRLLALDGTLRLRSATTGARGLELARDRPPDVILLDMQLTDMDGAEVVEALRADPRTAEIPVVVVSGDCTEARIERMRGLGVWAYLTKPIDLCELRRTVHAAAGTTTPCEVRPRLT